MLAVQPPGDAASRFCRGLVPCQSLGCVGMGGIRLDSESLCIITLQGSARSLHQNPEPPSSSSHVLRRGQGPRAREGGQTQRTLTQSVCGQSSGPSPGSHGPGAPGPKRPVSDSWGCFAVLCKRCPVGGSAGSVRFRGGGAITRL